MTIQIIFAILILLSAGSAIAIVIMAGVPTGIAVPALILAGIGGLFLGVAHD